MDHQTDSKSHPWGAARALVAALLACTAFLATAPAALAEPAVDEYKLELPTDDRAGLADVQSTQTLEDRGRPIGIIGEEEAASSPLEATASMLASTPLLVLALVIAIVVAALSLRVRGAGT